jgi:predicted nucleotidyltransferase
LTRFAELLRALAKADVRFVLVGGVAATAHGSARTTQDLDIVYERSDENLQRLVLALAPYEPYLRGAPPGLPFHLDMETLRSGLNFTLTSQLGWIDLFGEIPAAGRYEDLVSTAIKLRIFGQECNLIDLDTLIRAKRAAGRPKDYESLAELESIRDRKRPG